MNITLSDGTEIEIKALNLAGGQVDYRRLNGIYTGDCVLYLAITDLATAEADITAVLEAEIAEGVAA